MHFGDFINVSLKAVAEENTKMWNCLSAIRQAHKNFAVKQVLKNDTKTLTDEVLAYIIQNMQLKETRLQKDDIWTTHGHLPLHSPPLPQIS